MGLEKDLLRTLPTIWPLVAANIPAAVGTAQAYVNRPPDDLIRSLVTRWELGERLYKRDFIDWTREQFDQEIACEIADAILYIAMRRILYEDE